MQKLESTNSPHPPFGANFNRSIEMPSIKKSVMFSEATQDYIAARTREDGAIAWSQALNESFKALKWLSQQALPELSQNEWQTILNAHEGCIVSFNPPYRVAINIIDDALARIETDELGPGYTPLVKKVHGLSQIEQYAVMDFVQKFWSRDWSDFSDWDEIVRAIKAE